MYTDSHFIVTISIFVNTHSSNLVETISKVQYFQSNESHSGIQYSRYVKLFLSLT